MNQQKKIIKQQIKIITTEINLYNKQLRQENIKYKKTIILNKKLEKEKKEKIKLIKSLEKELHMYKNNNQETEENVVSNIYEKIENIKKENDNTNLIINYEELENNISNIQEKIIELLNKKFQLEKQLFI